MYRSGRGDTLDGENDGSGPLLKLAGRVIGVNAMIVSPSGGSSVILDRIEKLDALGPTGTGKTTTLRKVLEKEAREYRSGAGGSGP